jgi:hypothetical protein
MSHHKVVVYVPVAHADKLRGAIGDAGGGKLGNYAFCSFSTRGTGRFRPGPGATPAIGKIGKLEEVEEERIEVTCDSHLVKGVVAAIMRAHPYEEVAMDVWPLEEWR